MSSQRMAKILNALPYFVLVAEELHFGRAADRLGMSQPPLSRRIHNLEIEIGTALFRRTRQQTILTDAGKMLLSRASVLLDQSDNMLAELRRAEAGMAGQLRIGFVSSAAYSVLPSIIREFSRISPHVELSIQESPSIRQIRDLKNRQIDVGILRGSARDGALKSMVILKEKFICVLPMDHPMESRGAIRLRDLSEERFVMYSRTDVPRLRDTILTRCEAAGFEPKIAIEAISIPTIVALVNCGLGIALIPESSRPAVTAPLKGVPLEDDGVKIELIAATLRGQTSALADAFVRTARRVAIRLSRANKSVNRSLTVRK
jgi:DNA-binding transcriptional LysR family regulator